MRLAVALYLVIATAAGPWACCCTLTRLAARFAHANTPDTHPAEPRSCCKHKAPRGSATDAPARKAPDRPLSPDCPCKQAGGCSAEAIATPHDESRDDPLRTLTGGYASLIVPHLSHHTAAVHTALPSPWAYPGRSSLSKGELLHVLHILRC